MFVFGKQFIKCTILACQNLINGLCLIFEIAALPVICRVATFSVFDVKTHNTNIHRYAQTHVSLLYSVRCAVFLAVGSLSLVGLNQPLEERVA